MEIERKFLVKNNSWQGLAQGVLYKQGYLNGENETTVRIRIIEEQAFITIKGPVSGYSRAEFEYRIPLSDGLEMLSLCKTGLVEKFRFKIEYEGFLWEVDQFIGLNQGLVLAEIELEYEQQAFLLPPWVGNEVSNERRYSNSALARTPFSLWG